MGRRLPWKARIGIGLILASIGLFGSWRWWMVTRTWVPLDMPISLARGHIRSPEFKINLDGGFWVWVEVETAVDDAGVSCLMGYSSDYCEKNNIHQLRTSWTLSDSGKVVARGPTDRYPAYPYPTFRDETKARELGSFEAPGEERYVLDIDIPEDYSRFDAGHPHLAIVTRDYWIFENWQVWVALLSSLLAAIGLAMVLYPVAVWIRKKNDYQSISFTFPGPLSSGFVLGTASLDLEILKPRGIRLHGWVWVALATAIGGICGYLNIPPQWIAAIGILGASLFVLRWAAPLARLSKSITLDISPNHNQNIQWAQKLPLRRPINRIPGFGLIGGMVFAILALLMMMLTFGFRVTSTGEWVRLLKPGELPAKSDTWTEPLIVRVKDAGRDQPPRLLVNSKEVAWKDLDKALKQELAPRRDWVVYVGGDDTTSFQYVADVVDAARGLHAKVVLITEKNKSPAEN